MKRCMLPACKSLAFANGRLCEKHAAAGSDLRVPIYLIELGLDKVYAEMQKQKEFSAEKLIITIDKRFELDDKKVQANKLNGLAKLIRTLRANEYVTKVRHENGFVIYKANKWDTGVTVEIETAEETAATIAAPIIVKTEEESAVQSKTSFRDDLKKMMTMHSVLVEKQTGADIQIQKLLRKIDILEDKVNCPGQKDGKILIHTGNLGATNLNQKLDNYTQQINDFIARWNKQIEDTDLGGIFKNFAEIKSAMNVMQNVIKSLEESVDKLQKENGSLKQKLDGIKTEGLCPIGKIRLKQHPLIGGEPE